MRVKVDVEVKVKGEGQVDDKIIGQVQDRVKG